MNVDSQDRIIAALDEKITQLKNILEEPIVKHSDTEYDLKDLKQTLPCAAYLNGEYGIKNLYAGVPVKIGKNGVETIIEIKLSDEEKKQFNYSIKAVQELFDAAKKIDSSLA